MPLAKRRRFTLVIPLLSLLSLATLLGIVAAKTYFLGFGYRTAELRTEIRDLKHQQLDLRLEKARLISPEHVMETLLGSGLEYVPAQRRILVRTDRVKP